jgi:hypothetical protein
MPFIGARMHCDSIGAKTLGIDGGFYNVRIVATPAVTKGCKFVYVDRQSDHNAKV